MEVSGQLSTIISILASLLFVASHGAICYDHQPNDYSTRFNPADCNAACTVTPFFSPDHSVDTYLDLIQSAKESIDILTPGFDSWSKCTHYAKECDDDCIGCSIEDQQNEAFPIFAALLNAVHKDKIAVRIITNNYTQPTCRDMIAPLDWLYLNGIQIRFYTTTTFMHSKVVIVDQGKRTSISSVNFSQTSFTKNREAGVVIEDCSCPAINLYQSVFEYDWDNGIEYFTDNRYSASDMKVISDSSLMPVPKYVHKKIPGAYVTVKKSYSGVTVTKGYTSPDNALDTVLCDLRTVQTSLQLAIYQLTDDSLCNQTLNLFQNGVNISIIVSARIVSYADYVRAQKCYTLLYNNGMKGRIRKALTKFSFSHQKYWVIDSKEVHLSTGNWSPSDFPEGSTFAPHRITNQSINRDMLVVMEGAEIVDAFQTVFEKDWASGTEWAPKYMY